MIIGIGTDIVRVSRMQRDLDRFGEKFARRILTDHELVEFRQDVRKAHFLARRFAAKEAAAKALGTGFAHGIHLHDIGVAHDANGKPELVLTGGALKFSQAKGAMHAHISIADEEDHAVAFVTLEAG